MNNPPQKISPTGRRMARRLALQALYQWQISGNDLASIEMQFLVDNPLKKIDVPYFQELLHAIPKNLSDLEERMIPLLDRPLSEVDPVELTVLRMGTYELVHRRDVPYRVVINEALELAKIFGAEDGYKYVNGILDKLARELRKEEVN